MQSYYLSAVKKKQVRVISELEKGNGHDNNKPHTPNEPHKPNQYKGKDESIGVNQCFYI